MLSILMILLKMYKYRMDLIIEAKSLALMVGKPAKSLEYRLFGVCYK